MKRVTKLALVSLIVSLCFLGEEELGGREPSALFARADEARAVRIDVRNVRCLNKDDELGIAERDEIYFLYAVLKPDGTTSQRKTRVVDGVGDGDWAFREHSVIAQAKLKDGEMIQVWAALMEEDAGGGEELLEAVVKRIAVAGVTTGAAGAVAVAIEQAVELTVRQVLQRGNDDYLGSVLIRVSNIGGKITKELIPLKQTKIGGRGDYAALSKTKMTIRTRMDHKGDLNDIRYLTSFNVRDLDEINGPHPLGKPFTWSIRDGKGY